jgi:hypothetical protein
MQTLGSEYECCCCCCEGGGTEDFTSGGMQTLGSEYECCCCCEGGGEENFASGGAQTLGSEYECCCCCCCEGGGEENFASGGAQTLGSEYECCCCCCCEGGGEENFASGGAQTLGSEYECCCCCEGGGTEDFNFASLDAIDEKSTQAEMLGEADRAELIAALKRQNEALREGGAWLYRVERSGGAALPEGFDAAAFAEDLAAIASRPFYASIPMRVRAAEPRLVPAERWPIFSADETSLVLLSPEHFYAIDAAGREYHEFTRVAASAKGRVVRVENVRRLASPASDGAEASALEIRIVETPGEKPRVVTSEGKVSFDLTAPEGAMTPWAFDLAAPKGAMTISAFDLGRPARQVGRFDLPRRRARDRHRHSIMQFFETRPDETRPSASTASGPASSFDRAIRYSSGRSGGPGRAPQQ